MCERRVEADWERRIKFVMNGTCLRRIEIPGWSVTGGFVARDLLGEYVPLRILI